ncbi:hypothetical protein SCHPADRAFT_1001823 [Schizopora paradoxa]|uniref:BTB domain-containing protein n=1 Tax=Schizopora paradoxa TaxID=27342 RepID=A0A0H2R5T4_9AGAM|nr:hypothetical protein SCHPADRAFT_1001823 [Schizopora paradoxa]
MPPKRRRLNERRKAGDEGEEQLEGTPTTQSRPHDELWFSDGSIVLATDVHLYRVHKSMLAKYSKVLRDLFEIPTGDAEMESWEGVPIVRMVGDSDGEVYMLLKALYGVNLQVPALHVLTLSEVTSLLSISSKYDCKVMRADVIQRLESIFPNNLEKMWAAKLLWESFLPSHAFELLAVAHRCEALLILPTLFYLCARFPLEKSIGAVQALPQDVQKNFLLGRDWLLECSHRLRGRFLQSTKIGGLNHVNQICRSPECLEKIRAQLSVKPFALIFDVPDRGVLVGLDMNQSEICGDCAKKHVNTIRNLKKLHWDELPVKFTSNSWEELRKKAISTATP